MPCSIEHGPLRSAGAQVKDVMSEKPDPVEVGRKASELAASHGLGARRHAKTLAEAAEQAGDDANKEFWLAVAGELNPRCSI